MELKLSSGAGGRVKILALTGRFDSYTTPPVAEQIQQVTSSTTPRVVINLAGVEFMDSTALATLVQSMKHCRQQGGDLRLCNLRQPVRMIFELTRLDKSFEILASEEEAVRAFDDDISG